MQVDHLIYGVPVLATGAEELGRRLGVRAAGGGQHTGQGTHNTLLGLGLRTYLEIIAPDPTQPEPEAPRPYGVDGMTGAGLVGWAIACDDIAGVVKAARARGYDPGDVIEGHRRTAAGDMLRWRANAHARTAGLIPFLIDWGDTPHPAATAPQGLALISLFLEHPAPDELSLALRCLGADVEVRPSPTPAIVAMIEGPEGRTELR